MHTAAQPVRGVQIANGIEMQYLKKLKRARDIESNIEYFFFFSKALYAPQIAQFFLITNRTKTMSRSWLACHVRSVFCAQFSSALAA